MKTPQEIFAEANAAAQATGKCVLTYNPVGYDAIIKAMIEYGKQEYERGRNDPEEKSKPPIISIECIFPDGTKIELDKPMDMPDRGVHYPDRVN